MHRFVVGATVCALLQMVSGALFPTLCLTFMAPLVTSCYHRLDLPRCLWISFGVGLFVDLLAGSGRLGLLSLIYCLATGILYPQKRHFFPGILSTIPILSALYGLLLTLLTLLFYSPPGMLGMLHLRWIFTDLVVMPIANGLFALLGFVIPLKLLFYRRAKPHRYRMPRPE